MAVRKLPKDVLKMASGLISPSGLAGHRRPLCNVSLLAGGPDQVVPPPPLQLLSLLPDLLNQSEGSIRSRVQLSTNQVQTCQRCLTVFGITLPPEPIPVPTIRIYIYL